MKLVEQADPSKRSKELATVMTSAARMLGVGDVSELEEVAQYVPDLTDAILKQLDGNLRNLPDVLRNLRTLARSRPRACSSCLALRESCRWLPSRPHRCRQTTVARRDDTCAIPQVYADIADLAVDRRC